MSGHRHYTIHVSGRVQGVGFRYSAMQKARELDLTGYVRNLPDGSVLIEAEGEPGALDLLVEWCRQGPSWSRVERVEVEKQPQQGYTEFRIR
ncbi:MAG TPA: acylphosphatase [Bacteroidetes bacterium]|nr:acylphosphatase [Bacteroidota bacterium]